MKEKDLVDLLAKEAEAAEANDEAEESRPYRRPPPPKNPSQVYSIRLPVDCLEQLRKLAEKLNSRPTALLRQWALERLDEELGHRATYKDTIVGHVTVEISSERDVPHVSPEYLARRIGEHILNSNRHAKAVRT